MAMLAEPRRRQKYSTDPRGLTWATDGDKFGQKMLEKMGWEKGKGLGANEDGRKDHVKVDMKFNTRGVGCCKTYADNWIAHQDDFNSLLSQLNTDHGDSNTQETDSNSRVMSLEAKSKTSKSRVHYQKFTKGKDLSSRKVDDLACIFGKRKSKSEGNTPLQSEVNSDTEENKTDLEINGQKVDESHGVKTVTSSTSIADYFAEKMAQLKKSRAAQNSSNQPEDSTPFSAGQSPRDSENPDQSDEGISFSAKLDHTDSEASVQEDLTEKKKKKKKKKEKKKSKPQSQSSPSGSPDQSDDDDRISFSAKPDHDESNVTETAAQNDSLTEMNKKKKKKKSKRKLQDNADSEEPSCEKKLKCNDNGSDEESCKDEIRKKKKKKSKKSKKESAESPVGDNNEVADTEEVEEKDKSLQSAECENSESSASDKKNKEPSKKKKKQKDKDLPVDCKSDEVSSTDHSETGSSVQSNKRKKLPSELTQQIWSQAENDSSPPKRRKRRKNKEVVGDEDDLGFKGANLKQIKGYP